MKIAWNMAGFRALRTDPGVAADLMRRAERIAKAAGEGYDVQAAPSTNRARVTIMPDTVEAKIDNSRNNSLLRALDAGK